MRWLALAFVVSSVAACAPQTGLVLEVEGPDGTSSVAAGIGELRLVVAHASYCERWITDTQASTLTVDVSGRDLETDPVSILLTPDRQTSGIVGYDDEQPDPLRAYVLALGAGGALLGVAAFDPEPFVYEEVRRYTARVALFARSDAAYAAPDGCVCAPGLPQVGTSTGSGCDQRLPPSFARLVDTAGCELPPGSAPPIGVCDGQLYPGEKQNRELPCFAAVGGACRAGHRTCNDEGGRAYAAECVPDGTAPALPSSSFCDAYLACEQTACADPGACLQAAAGPAHHALRCTLPVSPTASMGASAACDDGDWTFSFDGLSGAACVATMLDGQRQGPVTIGWAKDAATPAPQLISTLCPPVLVVSRVDADPAKLPGPLSFSFSLGDTIYDVTLELDAECSAATSAVRRFRCTPN